MNGKCDTCDAPATHIITDVVRHEVPGEPYINYSYLGAPKSGCDAHPVTSHEFPTTEPFRRSTTFRALQKMVSLTAKNHGFWDVDHKSNPPTVDRKLMLIVGEIAEAHEDWRKVGLNMYVEQTPDGEKPCGFPTELADAVIRIMDLAEQLGIDLERYIFLKDSYNAHRPHMHGKRF